MAIYFTSDLHLNHDREFVWQKRGFNSVHEMNQHIIKMWNETVSEDDDVYVLGDLMLGDVDAGIALLHQLKGNIHICIGNHCTNSRIAAYQESYNVVEIKYSIMLKQGKRAFLMSHYPMKIGDKRDSGGLTCLCGHTHTSNKFLDIGDGSYHVELDAHNNQLVSIEKVIEDLIWYSNLDDKRKEFVQRGTMTND